MRPHLGKLRPHLGFLFKVGKCALELGKKNSIILAEVENAGLVGLEKLAVLPLAALSK